MRISLLVDFDETLVSAEFMADHILELEGVEAVDVGAVNEGPSAENDVAAHEHEWEVEYLPDPMSGGGVVRSGDLFCSCGDTREDRPIPPEVQHEQG